MASAGDAPKSDGWTDTQTAALALTPSLALSLMPFVTTPPSSLAVLYNELRVPKQILWCQGWTHGWSPEGMAKFTVDDGFDAATAKPDGK